MACCQHCMTHPACAQDACYLLGYGYNVTYTRFQGGHEVPPGVANSTMAFFLGTLSSMGVLPADLSCAP